MPLRITIRSPIMHAIHGAVLRGINAIPITVEVQLMRRLPSITVVGYAHHTIRESTERIRSAIEASGFSFPAKKVVVNLAPAETPKVGSSLDLPMALAILQATGALKNSLNQYLFVGEPTMRRSIAVIDSLSRAHNATNNCSGKGHGAPDSVYQTHKWCAQSSRNLFCLNGNVVSYRLQLR